MPVGCAAASVATCRTDNVIIPRFQQTIKPQENAVKILQTDFPAFSPDISGFLTFSRVVTV